MASGSLLRLDRSDDLLEDEESHLISSSTLMLESIEAGPVVEENALGMRRRRRAAAVLLCCIGILALGALMVQRKAIQGAPMLKALPSGLASKAVTEETDVERWREAAGDLPEEEEEEGLKPGRGRGFSIEEEGLKPGRGRGFSIDVVSDREEAEAREKRRKKMRIEVDLGTFVTAEAVGRGAGQAPADPADCIKKAGQLFDQVLWYSGLDDELDGKETAAFKARFDRYMEQGCKEDPLFTGQASHWIEGAKKALEMQKPIFTTALAENLNGENYEFEVRMQEWMVHESKATFEARLGRSSVLPEDAEPQVAEPGSNGRMGGWIPDAFDSAEQWPHCREEILQIHDQGICGSCWSFSCTQVLNARMCIQSDGRFRGSDASLSPGYFASCAPHGGHPGDGCAGGWEYYCYKYIDMPGTPGGVSETCSPYFGRGSGVNHFTQKSIAPTCPTTCSSGYSRTLAQDGFKLPGIGRHRLLMPANTHAHAEAKQAILHGGTVNHGIHASGQFMGYNHGVFNLCSHQSANHAVVTYGWFPGGYLSKNSWGERWGEGGKMRLADCMITDFTVPGDFDVNQSHIPYPLGRQR